MRNIRKDYEKGKPIVIKEENKPLELLEIWINDALENGVTEPNAMNIATVDSNGYPRNRMVLIKYLENEQIGFFTNLKSDKSIELQGNSRISCTICILFSQRNRAEEPPYFYERIDNSHLFFIDQLPRCYFINIIF